MKQTEEILTRGIEAVKSGRKAQGRKLLLEVLQRNNQNEAAWLWLSDAVDRDEDRRTCLEHVLEINPDNDVARLRLTSLDASEGLLPVQAPQDEARTSERGHEASPTAKTGGGNSRWRWALAGIGAVALMLLFVWLAGYAPGIVQLLTDVTRVTERLPGLTTISEQSLAPIADVDLEDVLLLAEDLTFASDYAAAGWQRHPCGKRYIWPTDSDYAFPELAYVSGFANACWSYAGTDTEVVEAIYVVDTDRQAARLAESIISEYASIGGYAPSSRSEFAEFDGHRVWLSEAGGLGYWSWSAVMTVDEAVIFFDVSGSARFISEDVVELGSLALASLHEARQP